jgi:selenide,water dikinase
VLSGLPGPTDARVLVDYRTADDAGVYQLDQERALVQTVDFFTPIVDDPYVFGQIAAANALSDVYAMGGRPVTALAIAAFPAKDFDPDDMAAVFKGGLDKLTEAGVALLGGHTLQDVEIKFGYAVTGLVHPGRILANRGAVPGDTLLLTKPLGSGIVSTAIKGGRAPAEAVDAAVQSMVALNAAAASVLGQAPPGTVHACTDITGFGLIGHSTELAVASAVTLRLELARLPLLPGVRELAVRNRSGGGATNLEYFAGGVQEPPGFDDVMRAIVYDPQTSGGLLAAVDPGAAPGVLDGLRAAGVAAVAIGEVVEASEPVRILFS